MNVETQILRKELVTRNGLSLTKREVQSKSSLCLESKSTGRFGKSSFQEFQNQERPVSHQEDFLGTQNTNHSRVRRQSKQQNICPHSRKPAIRPHLLAHARPTSFRSANNLSRRSERRNDCTDIDTCTRSLQHILQCSRATTSFVINVQLKQRTPA